MDKNNDILRSALSIARRKGKYTNWEAFENKIERELNRQARQEAEEIKTNTKFRQLFIHLQEMDFEDIKENADYHARLIFTILGLKESDD